MQSRLKALQRPAMARNPAGPRLPKLVAFDLDDTLWTPEMWQLNGGPPFKAHHRPGVVVDSSGQQVGLMGHSLKILQQLASEPHWQGSQVAYVSRTEYPEYAIPCLQAIQVLPGVSMMDMSAHQEIYPDRKTEHFRKIHKRTGIAYSDMIFFDNERRNITDCKPLGITCVYTPQGMTEQTWLEGLQAHAAKAASTEDGARRGGSRQDRDSL